MIAGTASVVSLASPCLRFERLDNRIRPCRQKAMAATRVLKKKKSKLGTTLLIVGVVHLGIGAGLYWVSQTQWGQDMIKVYKLNAFRKEDPPPPPEKEPEPEPEPEPPKPEPKPQEAPPPPPPQAEAPPPPKASDAPAGPPPMDANPFAIGKGRSRFAGYTDIVTASIQAQVSAAALAVRRS